MWLWLAAAHAEPVGHWHPDDLAPRSTVFRDTSLRLQEPFTDRSNDTERLAVALRQYREALDLLGTRAPEVERERLEALEKTFGRERAALDAFANTIITDYDLVYMAAVQRALAAHGGEIEECEDQQPVGPAMPGMPSRTQKNPDCHGPELNGSLAQSVDSDPELKAALDEILSRPWPTITIAVQQAAPVGGGDRYLLVRDLFVAGAKATLKAIDQEDDDARMKIEAAIEGGASVEELKRLEPEAAKIEAQTAEKRATLADNVLTTASARIAKRWVGEAGTGWCANPVLLGGCTGQNATSELVSRLLDDRKVAKALAAAK